MFTRLLTLLQFTRIALVFTAIADGWTAMLLQARATGTTIPPAYAFAMTIASAALYTFGMSLNDLIDRRRDSQLAPGRPLPSGRMSVRTARVVCIGLGTIAVAAGVCISLMGPTHVLSVTLVIWTLLLIIFYDFTGKYLVAPGLLSLGMVRFFHAAIAAPTLAFPWHAVVLLVHVTLLSTVCYALEAKRPRLTIRHWLLVSGGLTVLVAGVISMLIERRVTGQETPWTIARLTEALWIRPGLLYVAAAAVTFIALAIVIYTQSRDARTAGRSIMLYGLLWLIVYDASFILGFVGWRQALIVFCLLPFAFVAVQAMRTWSRIVDLSHAPQFQRAR